MKKKFSILLIMVVAVLTLAVVGYAGWYITRDPKTETGNVTAYAVNTDEITVELCGPDGTSSGLVDTIIFGKPSGDAIANAWLRFDNTVATEVLTVYIKVTAQSAGTFDVATGNYNSGVFGTPTFTQQSVNNATFNTSNGRIVFTAAGDVVVGITYTWGLNQNPYTYFNTGKTKNGELDSSAKTLADNVGLTGYTAGTTKYAEFAEDYLAEVFSHSEDFSITVTEYLG